MPGGTHLRTLEFEYPSDGESDDASVQTSFSGEESSGDGEVRGEGAFGESSEEELAASSDDEDRTPSPPALKMFKKSPPSEDNSPKKPATDDQLLCEVDCFLSEHCRRAAGAPVQAALQELAEAIQNFASRPIVWKKKREFSYEAAELFSAYFPDTKSPFETIREELRPHKNLIYTWMPPRSVSVSGSYALKICNNAPVDVDLHMPDSMFDPETDVRPRVYSFKRLLYLSVIAKNLLHSPLSKKSRLHWHCDSVQHIHHPSIKLELLDPDSKAVFLLRPRISPTALPIQQVLPHRLRQPPPDVPESVLSCLNRVDYICANHLLSDALSQLHALEIRDDLSHFPSLRLAIHLSVIWSQSRRLTALNTFLISMIYSNLLHLHQDAAQKDHLHLFVDWLRFLSDAQDTTPPRPNILSSTSPARRSFSKYSSSFRTKNPHIDHSVYDAVFLDRSRLVNLFAHLSLSDWLKIQHHASLSLELIQHLQSPKDVAHSLLSSQQPSLLLQNDLAISIHLHPSDSSPPDSPPSDSILLQHCLLSSLLPLALFPRIHHCTLSPPPLSWPLCTSAPLPRLDYLLFLQLKPDHWLRSLELGPSPQLQHPSAQFKLFWGPDKVTLRKFKDGLICHGLLWCQQHLSELRHISHLPNLTHSPDHPIPPSLKHLIPLLVVQYVINRWINHPSRHFHLSASIFADHLLSSHTTLSLKPHSTIMDSLLCFEDNWTQLKSTLLKLQHLPIPIESASLLGPLSRLTSPTPPLPNHPYPIRKLCPHAPTVSISFSPSNAWPQDLNAISLVKSSFYLELSKQLRTQCAVPSTPHSRGLFVFFHGYSYQLSIHYQKESNIRKKINTQISFIKKKTTLPSLLPPPLPIPKPHSLVNSLLRTLQHTHPSYAPTCHLLKIWLSSHLIPLDQLHDGLLVDLLVTRLFHPLPTDQFLQPPNHPHLGFYLSLQLLSSLSPNQSPILLPISETPPWPQSLRHSLIKSWKKSSKPHFFTIFYSNGSSKTSHHPPFTGISTLACGSPSLPPSDPLSYSSVSMIWKRTQTLARQCLRTLLLRLHSPRPDLSHLFQPPISDFDVLIELNLPPKLPSIPSHAKPCPTLHHLASRPVPEQPHTRFLVQFDPVSDFVNSLSQLLNQHAIVFHNNSVIGNLVAILWKPSCFSLNTLLTHNHSILIQDHTQLCRGFIPNVFELLRHVHSAGSGLIQSVHIATGNSKLHTQVYSQKYSC